MKTVNLKNLLPLFLPFVVSAVMLTVIQPPFRFRWLCWVCLVPFILGSLRQAGGWRLFICAYIVSLVYWLVNLYWIRPVTTAGWLAFCFYTALLWPLQIIALRWCRAKKIPLLAAAAVIVVGAERLQGLFLGGFFWRFLAHSQYDNISLIQIADIFGAGGVSFLIAMVNGLAAGLIIDAWSKKLFRAGNFLKIGIVGVLVAGAILYGRWRIYESDKFVEAGPLIGMVQSNVPQSVKGSGQADERIFEDLLADSEECVTSGAELIVWPETMVPAVLDTEVLRYLDPCSPHRKFDERLKQHSRDRVFLLVGAVGAEPEMADDLTIDLLARRYNSAFLYTPAGRQADKKYNKIHLVPFGEVVPFRKTAPWLHSLLMKFTPYDYDYSLDYGTEYTVFQISGDADGRVYKFAVMICYEDAVPEIGRRFALNSQGKKRTDWLVNISNDGWFVTSENGRTYPSSELAQHTAVCVFRAVENRLAVLRSVNTGISCMIDSLGRIRDGFAAGSVLFPVSALKRQCVAGWFADKVPIDKRVSFFSRYGQWLDFCCAVGLIFPAVTRLIKRKAKVKRQ